VMTAWSVFPKSTRHEQPKLDAEKDEGRADEPRLAAPRHRALTGLPAPPEPDTDRQAGEGRRPIQQVQRVGRSPAHAEEKEPEKPVGREDPDDDQDEAIRREAMAGASAGPRLADPGPSGDGQQGAGSGNSEEGQKLMRNCHVRANRA
jgi:hypothetical protein